ncbi:hypothetical protein NKR23_g9582 [Pleurostoma richardsiae]|uniref:YMC020W-like alpha/beta hydrolase domain-containing protein n=1 Tax=Pleurostoma richardsiae TaxID=41990 RepID=A0AA38VJC0_9PEZI|nr:hypothetical protein NKR23_g9582 [Pleurostoma richardsiae]
MSPRKRAKPNPGQGSSASVPSSGAPSQPSTTSQTSEASNKSGQPPSATTEGQNTPTAPWKMEKSETSPVTPKKDHKQVHKTRSWYGSWPRAPKSAASTQVARENIHGGTLKPSSTPDFSRFDTKKTGSDNASIAAPNSSTTTLPNIQEGAGDVQIDNNNSSSEAGKTAASETANKHPTAGSVDEGSKDNAASDSSPPAQEPPTTSDTLPASEQQQASSTWLSWFARPSGPAIKSLENGSAPLEHQKETEQPEHDQEHQQQQSPPQVSVEETENLPVRPPPIQPTAQSTTSWFSFWSSDAAPAKPTDAGKPVESASEPPSKEPEDVVMQEAPPPEPEQAPPPRGSTWAFWSRDSRIETDEKPAGSQAPQPESGELAIMGEGSETHPKRAKSMDIDDRDSIKTPTVTEGRAKDSKARDKTTKKSKRIRPQSMDLDDSILDRPDTPKSDTSSLKGDSITKAGSSKTLAATKTTPANLLLPTFRGTYRLKDNPSILKQIAQLLLRTQQPPVNHVFLSKEPPKIKKALAIGVHGLFPATYLRPMIGQPTGTSIKFANHCAEGIRRWADSHGCEDCEIEKVALEGEGKIGERVENLWKLLLNWMDHIRSADLIVVACHSQGVPVSVMLVAKLIELGIITTARIGVCAMAGVSLGPFPDYKSGMGILMGSAAELWEFANSESEIFKRYETSLAAILKYGVRVTYIGSIDDQLVPMESSVYSPAHHPYIYRAVFIDGRLHAPDFIAHLVGFALKLRNLGISDHGLIRELSVPLAGSLYGGEGHSRLYDDPHVYDLAIAHTLETSDVGDVPCDIKKYEGLTSPNPYHLPWIMRGLLEEEFVKTELSSETAELLKQFDDWKPATKALKDVKYRLEVVRSKL